MGLKVKGIIGSKTLHQKVQKYIIKCTCCAVSNTRTAKCLGSANLFRDRELIPLDNAGRYFSISITEIDSGNPHSVADVLASFPPRTGSEGPAGKTGPSSCVRMLSRRKLNIRSCKSEAEVYIADLEYIHDVG